MILLRIIGNCLVMAGYPILLYLHPVLGAMLKTIGHIFLLCYFINFKAWDMLASLFFFATLDIVYLIQNWRKSSKRISFYYLS